MVKNYQSTRPKGHGFDPWVGKIPGGVHGNSTPVFLPGEFHGQRSLAGYSLWVARVRYNLKTTP